MTDGSKQFTVTSMAIRQELVEIDMQHPIGIYPVKKAK